MPGSKLEDRSNSMSPRVKNSGSSPFRPLMEPDENSRDASPQSQRSVHLCRPEYPREAPTQRPPPSAQPGEFSVLRPRRCSYDALALRALAAAKRDLG